MEKPSEEKLKNRLSDYLRGELTACRITSEVSSEMLCPWAFHFASFCSPIQLTLFRMELQYPGRRCPVTFLSFSFDARLRGLKTETLMRANILALLLNGCLALAAFAAGKAEHIVVVVWDGMRPDFMTEQYTPALRQLAQEGVFFQNHHPVYLSATEVNGTAISTGAYPAHTGIMAKKE